MKNSKKHYFRRICSAMLAGAMVFGVTGLIPGSIVENSITVNAATSQLATYLINYKKVDNQLVISLCVDDQKKTTSAGNYTFEYNTQVFSFVSAQRMTSSSGTLNTNEAKSGIVKGNFYDLEGYDQSFSTGVVEIKLKLLTGKFSESDFSLSAFSLWDIESIKISDNSTATVKYDDITPLVNESTISSTDIILGDKVTITGKSSGGKSPITYKYEYQKSGKTTWTSFGSGTTAVFKPGEGTFTVRVTATDKAGKTAVKSFTVKCTTPLLNDSTVSANEILLGDKVTINGKASGGTAPYTYKYEYQKSGKTTWTSFGSGKTALFKPGEGTFTVRVTVTDSAGKTTPKTFTVKCTTPLLNNSTVSATEIALGDKVTINGKASGGTAPYTYKYEYQKVGKTTWTAFGSGKTALFKPGEGTFTVRVTVTDSAGKTAKKTFTVKCTAPFQNISTVSATSIKLGDKVTINAKATGGTTPYTYKYEYQKEGKTTWTEFGSGATALFKPGTGTFTVRVTIKDSDGQSKVKSFTITCS